MPRIKKTKSPTTRRGTSPHTKLNVQWVATDDAQAWATARGLYPMTEQERITQLGIMVESDYNPVFLDAVRNRLRKLDDGSAGPLQDHEKQPSGYPNPVDHGTSHAARESHKRADFLAQNVPAFKEAVKRFAASTGEVVEIDPDRGQFDPISLCKHSLGDVSEKLTFDALSARITGQALIAAADILEGATK